ncbi:hypothetical protein JN403_12270 [Pseudomonas sp. 15A4]|uniref:hypothetical protein n=1 Tax=Pseudomonas sp. 15A4 TaxID=2804761 RepID=UPI00196850BE|nr:hypothetical protein [Pseudomonas sp. 15A4]QSB21522.1 hypothetical protein JN403_12270 [Pseudomonas sp. 15A4]
MKILLLSVSSLLLTGCVSTPLLVYKYYPAKATAQVSVTQTIDCDADKHLVILNTPSISSIYSSDRRGTPLEFDASKLGTVFTDNDFTFAWYDDGRLRSLNSAVTGQGEAIVKSATTLLAVITGGAAATDEAAACKVVASRGSGKPVTVVYERALDDLTQVVAPTALTVSQNYKGNYDALIKVVSFPLLEVKVDIAVTGNPILVEPSASAGDAGNEGVPLTLARTTVATITVTKGKVPIGKSAVIAPTAQTYALSVPSGALFGKATFSVQLNEAGVPTQVSYGKTSSAAAALNSASTLDSALSPNDAAQASALKAQADVIAQTARLANCQAKPSECK